MGRKYKYRGKLFRTKRAKNKYKSWEPIIRDSKKVGVPRSTLKTMRRAQRSWIGK